MAFCLERLFYFSMKFYSLPCSTTLCQRKQIKHSKCPPGYRFSNMLKSMKVHETEPRNQYSRGRSDHFHEVKIDKLFTKLNSEISILGGAAAIFTKLKSIMFTPKFDKTFTKLRSTNQYFRGKNSYFYEVKINKTFTKLNPEISIPRGRSGYFYEVKSINVHFKTR